MAKYTGTITLASPPTGNVLVANGAVVQNNTMTSTEVAAAVALLRPSFVAQPSGQTPGNLASVGSDGSSITYSPPPTGTYVQYASESARTASTTVHAAGTLVTTGTGAVYVGDGATQAKNLTAVASKAWRAGMSLTNGDLVRLPTGEIVTAPSTLTTGSTYTVDSNGYFVNWVQMPATTRNRVRNRNAVRRTYRRALKRVTIPTASTIATTTAAISTSAAITSIPVSGLTSTLAAGVVRLDDGTNEDTFYTTGAASGATSIPVASKTPTYAFAGGVNVRSGFASEKFRDLPNIMWDGVSYTTDFDVRKFKNTSTNQWYFDSVNGQSTNTGQQVATLSAALTAGVAVTALTVPALAATVPAGTVTVLYTDDQGVPHKQTFTNGSSTAAGATSIPVTSANATYSFPVGSLVVSPLASIATIYNKTGFTAGDTINVLDRRSNSAKGIVYLSASNSGTTIKKSLNVIAMFPGEPRFVCCTNDTYTATSGQPGVYQLSKNYVTRVVDLDAKGTTASYGTGYYSGSAEGMEYLQVTSLAACQSTPGSWFVDTTPSPNTVYMHTLDGSQPSNTRHFALTAGNVWSTTDNNDGNVCALYLEGFALIGGNNGCVQIVRTNGGTNHVDLFLYNMGLFWPGNVSPYSANCMSTNGGRYVYTQACLVVGAQNDNLSYHPRGTLNPTPDQTCFIEVNNVSYSAGYQGGAINPNSSLIDTYNATTCHEGSRGIRIGGIYLGGGGAPVADVHSNTQTVNYSCVAGDSESTNPSYYSSWSAQQAYTEMFIYSCDGFGSPGSDIWVTGSAVVHADRCQFDTKAPFGTYLETNPL